MTKTLLFLAATTALTVVMGPPAWSAIRSSVTNADAQPFATVQGDGQQSLPLVYVSNDDDDDDDDDDDHGKKRSSRHDNDDGKKRASRHDDDDDDDDCDDDKDGCRGAAGNPAPAGSVAPPNNGLFGTGTAPKAQMN